MKIYFIIFILFLNIAKAQEPKLYTFKNIPNKVWKEIVDNNKELFSKEPNLKDLEDISKLFYQTDTFESISIYYDNNKFVVQAENFRVISRIQVKGNKNFRNSEIIDIFGLETGDRFNFQSIYDGAEKIKEFYAKNGYLNTRVDIIPTNSDTGRTLIEIQIDEEIATEIKEIRFSTTFQDLNTQLNSRLSKFLKKPLTEERVLEIENTVKDFFSSQKILSAIIQGPQFEYNQDKSHVTLIYSLENPYRYLITFEGNSYFSQTELVNKIEIEKKAQFGANPGAEIQNRIEKLYKTAGFSNILIKNTETTSAKSFLRKIHFQIQEGPRTFIHKINFNGKMSKPEKYYIQLFKNIYKNSIYESDKIKKTQELFLLEMQNEGFLKSRFISSQTTYERNNTQANIQFFFDEGPQTIVKSIQFLGAKSFSKNLLQDIVDIQEGSPIQLDKLENSFLKIRNFYLDSGYLDVEIQSEFSNLVQYSKDNTEAQIQFKIYEGPKVKVGQIIVEGNKKTRSSFIVNELEFEAGDILTPKKIEDSEFLIQKTGLFSAVDILTVETGSQVDVRTVLIRVTERDPGLFNFGLGVNTEFEFTIRGYAGISYNNISGKGRAISLRTEVKQVQDVDFVDHRVTLGYLEPTLFAKRTRARVTFLRSSEIISRTDEVGDQDAKILETNRLSFLLEKDFSRYFKLTHVLWSISTNKEFLFPNRVVLEDVNIASIGPIFEYDRRDHPFVTKSGYYAKASVDYGDEKLGSSDNVQYLRNIGQLNTYTPLKIKDIVWANSVSGGHLKNYNKTQSVPDVKEFFLGGRDSLRGFEPNEIPRETDKNGIPVEVLTESYYYLVKSELRIPIQGQIETVLFYDGGSVIVKGNTFKDNYRDSIGIGFRYQTPVGPFSVEYGHRLDRDRDLDEPAGRFHLSFGTF